MALTAEQDAMVQKILKLLELGKEEKNEHAGQREAANAKAAELMAKYSIDFADLRSGKSVKGMFSRFDLNMGNFDPVHWEGSLALAISDTFDVKVVQQKMPWVLMFCGTKVDIEISVFFFKYLQRSVGMQSERYSRNRDERETFAYGMVHEIDRRLKELYKLRNEAFTNNDRALMVVKTDGLADYLKDQFPNLRKGRSHALRGSMAAGLAGREAGSKVNLSRPLAGRNGSPTGQLK